MDIQVNMIYLKDAKPYESKQFRCEIEATGLLPDEPMIREKKRRHTGNLQNRLGLGFAMSGELTALDAIEVNVVTNC